MGNGEPYYFPGKLCSLGDAIPLPRAAGESHPRYAASRGRARHASFRWPGSSLRRPEASATPLPSGHWASWVTQFRASFRLVENCTSESAHGVAGKMTRYPEFSRSACEICRHRVAIGGPCARLRVGVERGDRQWSGASLIVFAVCAPSDISGKKGA